MIGFKQIEFFDHTPMTRRTLVLFDAGVEMVTGVALIAAPDVVSRLLLGVVLSGGGIAVARVAGLGLLSLGVACWLGATGVTAQTIWALLTYNVLVTLYLGYLRIGGGFAGSLLWPVIVLHALLTVLLGATRE